MFQGSRTAPQGVGSLHPDHQRAHTLSATPGESCEEKLLGVWPACCQVQNGNQTSGSVGNQL